MPTTKAPPKRGKSARTDEVTRSTRGPAKKATSARKSPARQSSARKTGTRASGGGRVVGSRSAAKRTPPEVGTVTFESSSGNVFADMGARNAEERLAKAELARIVRGLVRERQASEGWTQAQAAAVLGIKAPDMSNLLRGKLAGFSQERIEHFLTRLGMDVRIQVAPRSADSGHAAITVERVAAFSSVS
jgi:predicted XRE-type DNA-binding protein